MLRRKRSVGHCVISRKNELPYDNYLRGNNTDLLEVDTANLIINHIKISKNKGA